MKKGSVIVFLFFHLIYLSQNDGNVISKRSMLYDLRAGDSVTIYQCHVESGTQQLTTASGQTVKGRQQKYSITEKYVLHPTGDSFRVNYYAGTLTAFPNRKFSGLKIREKSYWGFSYVKSFTLSEAELKVLLALEDRGREAIEYDFEINKYTTNQIILKKKKNFKQLVIDGDYVISRLIKISDLK